VNLLAHVWMAQEVLPAMIERGNGALIQTISSAALITGPSGMGYTLTKHGALGFAEWVALNYADAGIRVVCLCPNAVNTGMLGRDEDCDQPQSDAVDPELLAALGDVVEPEDCAACAVEALDAGRFLALPHPRVGESFARKANDYDAWLSRTSERLGRMRSTL
jgi:NAD(P)-dependent dehydrogenase (short-subunit alcohol dehydrogenase family)